MDGWMDGQYGWMDRMDGWNGMEWVDGWKPFPLQIEDSTGFFSSDRQSLPQTGRIEDLRTEFLWNLQSSIFNPNASRGLQICIKV